MTTSRDKLLDIIEELKEKLNSAEYQDLLLELAKLPEGEIVKTQLASDSHSDLAMRSELLRRIPLPITATEEDLDLFGCSYRNFAFEGEELDPKYIGGTMFEYEKSIDGFMIRNIITSLGYEMESPFDFHMPTDTREPWTMAIRTTYPHIRLLGPVAQQYMAQRYPTEAASISVLNNQSN